VREGARGRRPVARPARARGPTSPRKIDYRPGTIKAQLGTHILTWAFVMRAGDENRTRTISLGSRAVPPGYRPDLVTRRVSSSRG